jgi:hypothetical protein
MQNNNCSANLHSRLKATVKILMECLEEQSLMRAMLSDKRHDGLDLDFQGGVDREEVTRGYMLELEKTVQKVCHSIILYIDDNLFVYSTRFECLQLIISEASLDEEKRKRENAEINIKKLQLEIEVRLLVVLYSFCEVYMHMY